jgi:hypothetical protein
MRAFGRGNWTGVPMQEIRNLIMGMKPGLTPEKKAFLHDL